LEPISPVVFTIVSSTSSEPIKSISLGSKLPGLKPSELKLLRQKQTQLSSTALSIINSPPLSSQRRNALEATLIFAQHEAGTAVCISKSGLIITCAHCFGDTEEEYHTSDKFRWLLYYTGLAVQVECRAWDLKRDLALLQVVAIETSKPTGSSPVLFPEFKFVSLSHSSQTYKMPIFCIGQPGRDDLESTSKKKTKYKLVEISEGVFRGMVKNKDPQDNEEIGSLQHDAWTYWGHSGAPLVKEADGSLVGLHSSWDSENGMRHGIPELSINQFLRLNGVSLGESN
jgi:hypothetical protein